MSFFKAIFDEARNTDVSWEDSHAKEFEYKFNTAVKNKKIFTLKTLRTLVPIDRLDPVTLKVLEWYPSRFEAAKWLVENGITDDHELLICGNIELAIQTKNEAYGFSWKPLELTTFGKRKMDVKKGSKMVMVIHFNQGTRTTVYPSVNEAMKVEGIHEATISKYCNAERGMFKGRCYRWYNLVPRTEHVDSYKQAAHIWGVGPEKAKEWVKKGKSFNNITIELNDTGKKRVAYGIKWAEMTKENQGVYKPKRIKIFNKMGYLIYTSSSIRDAAKYTGLSPEAISYALAGKHKNRRFRFELDED